MKSWRLRSHCPAIKSIACYVARAAENCCLSATLAAGQADTWPLFFFFLRLNVSRSGGTCPGLYEKSLIIRSAAYLTIRQPTPTQKLPSSHRYAQIKLYRRAHFYLSILSAKKAAHSSRYAAGRGGRASDTARVYVHTTVVSRTRHVPASLEQVGGRNVGPRALTIRR